MPIGIQSQLQANYAFAEASQTINDEVVYSHGGKNLSNSSSSESKSKSNVYAINPFDSSMDNENKGAKMDIIIPDIAGPNTVSDTQPGSTTNTDESGTQSSGHFKPNSVDKGSSDIDDIDSSNDTIIKEHQNPETSELRSTQLQINAVNNNSVDKNIDDINNSVAEDIPSADNTESKLDSQPIYESYLPTIDNRDANKSNTDDNVPGNAVNINNSVDKNIDATRNPPNDDIPSGENTYSKLDSQLTHESNRQYIGNSDENKSIDDVGVPGNKVDTEITPMNSSINPDIGNDTADADENMVIQDNQPTTTNKSEFTGSQLGLDSQPKYKSYRDYMEKNNLIKNEIKINVPAEVNKTKPSSADNSTTFNGTNKQGEINSESATESFSASMASSQVTAQSSAAIHGDFNGDAKDDLAIGVPFEDIGLMQDAGAVQVVYGSSVGLSATSLRPDQFWSQDSSDLNNAAEVGDFFGLSLVTGDFNGDDADDLAIGVPGEDLATIVDSGGVQVIYGSPHGLSATLTRPDQFWTQDSLDIEGGVEPNDGFGQSLIAGDFNGDGKDDLAIGVPGEGIGSIETAGGVHVLYGSSSGLSATLTQADQFWTLDSPDVNGASEAVDLFGDSLSAGDFNGDGRDDLAIGVPGKDIGWAMEAGAVKVIYGSSSGLSLTLTRPDQFWSQDSPDVNNGAEENDLFGDSLSAGDFNGDGKDDLAIGVPAEDLGPIESAGAVQVIYGSSSGLSATLTPDQFWWQNSTDIAATAGQFDNFGTSLSASDFNGDSKDDLSIGVPGEDIHGVVEAGAVNLIYGSSGGLSATLTRSDQFWSQDSPDVNNGAEEDDLFGSSLSAGDFDGDGRGDLAIGVPAEDLAIVQDAGAVQVIYGSSNGLSATLHRADQFWWQDSPDIAASAGEFDGFGSALG